MKIILAPMEGVVDAQMRSVLTEIGGYDRCVTEFVRVTEQLVPDHVFLRYSPELHQGGCTSSGVPVYVQLLGGNAHYMGLNAARLAKLSPPGIDINFGCPSKTVNKSDGGSVLLLEPQRVGDIVKSVRDSVDPTIPVTAKIRLGFNDSDCLTEIVSQIVAAGATELAIHARTKADRYKPPAYWSVVNQVAEYIDIPLSINGEIWSISDANQALSESGCTDMMLGRGALSFPDLARLIKSPNTGALDWLEVVALVTDYLVRSEAKHPLFVSGRTKQWLGFLQMHYPQAGALFQKVKRMKEESEVLRALDAELARGSQSARLYG